MENLKRTLYLITQGGKYEKSPPTNKATRCTSEAQHTLGQQWTRGRDCFAMGDTGRSGQIYHVHKVQGETRQLHSESDAIGRSARIREKP